MMNNYKSFYKKFLSALLGCVILATISYFYWDRAIAEFVVQHQINHYLIFKYFTLISNCIDAFIFVLFIYLFVKLYFQAWNKLETHFFYLGISVAATNFIVRILKIIFGRYWPDTWVQNNPSWIQHHAYGFHLFHQGSAYASFPSGHTATVFAAMIVLWQFYPRYRWFSALLCALVVIGLIGMDYHYLSDIIAGAFIGTVIAVLTVKISNRDDSR